MEKNKNLTQHNDQILQSDPQNLGVSDNKLVIQNELTNENIKDLIYTIRGKQVMLDSDVAMLYQYETKNLNKAVKRNIDRFPEDFCFQITKNEINKMWLQNGTTSKGEKINIEVKNICLMHLQSKK